MIRSLCISHLVGTTTMRAKPGIGKQLLDMAATMPGDSFAASQQAHN